jgi:hypothetical protein
MDLGFANIGYNLSTDNVVLIVPGKWNMVSDDWSTASINVDYRKFREKLVPHMYIVIYYPCSKEVFPIYLSGGITIYAIDHDTHVKCKVINKSTKQPLLNSTSFRSLLNRSSLWNIGSQVINHLGEYKSFKFDYDTDKNYKVVYTDSYPAGGSSLCLDIGYLVIPYCRLLDTNEYRQSTLKTSIVAYSSDNKDECKYFISYLECKLIKLLIMVNLHSRLRVIRNDNFRFVPEPMVLDGQGNKVPGSFDHYYTDSELYKTWNIPQEYIDIIDAIVRHRDPLYND